MSSSAPSFVTVQQLEERSGHVHNWVFYDNTIKTFDELLEINEDRQRNPNYRLPVGTVFVCSECQAREVRFINHIGKMDPRLK